MMNAAPYAKRELAIWRAMRQRCANPRSKGYRHYGGRGIRVCERWRESFDQFLSDVGFKPDGMSLDRIDNDRGYEPGNCRWVTQHEQMRNTRANRLLTIGDRTQTCAAWAEEVGISPQVLDKRLSFGWTVGAAVTRPVRASKLRTSITFQARHKERFLRLGHL